MSPIERSAGGGTGTGFLFAPVKNVALIDIVSTSAAVQIIGAAGFVVAANSLGATGTLVCRIQGDYLNNTGATQTVAIIASLGGTTFFQDTSGNQAAVNRRFPVYLELVIQNLTTGSQFMSINGGIGQGAAPTVGEGKFLQNAPNANPLSSAGSVAVDTTLSNTLSVTWQHSSNLATNETRIFASSIFAY